MREKRAHGTEPETVTVSGPSATPWLNILLRCLSVAGVGILLTAVIAFFASGLAAAGSVLFGAAVVVVFFSLSLLVGHIYGRKNPSGAIGVFMITYLVKVVGFAVILFSMGQPGWLHAQWFAMSGVVAVVLWQATEVVAFSKQRILVFDEDAPAASSDKVN